MTMNGTLIARITLREKNPEMSLESYTRSTSTLIKRNKLNSQLNTIMA
jgi:hypothetical protein